MLLAGLLVVAMQANQPSPQKDTCLVFISTNLAKGNDNYFTYYQFSNERVKVLPGDMLSYDLYLDSKNPVAKGSVDIEFTDGGNPLRDLHIKDQYGIDAHGDGLQPKASGAWITRLIPLELAQGRITSQWNLVFEGDQPGKYVEFVDNVKIIHKDGKETSIYKDGPAPAKEFGTASGYSKQPYCLYVDRDQVAPNTDLSALIAKLELSGQRLAKLEETRRDIGLAKKFLDQNPDLHLEQHVKQASALLNALESEQNPTAEEIEAVLHEAQAALAHTHPAMERYTGHLVGHAHIDLQWLWEWQEGIIAAHDTFSQAIKFMDEFPGFTFSQSSSCLYQTTEENYPDLFKQIQEKVKAGQWEVVGGRICEGDTNMISPESTAMHFLYGQRYFREKLGKSAIVGWEPDTFGHNLQMPQILKMGGCNYYYFCRGGKGKPLFWWKGLDGTKILTFDEPASGSWYNSDLSYKQFQEMLDFQENTGSKDMLWVYGVGNHGGGPTREYINVAESWMKDPSKPKVQFSTATQFFKKLETYDLAKIPVVDEELNPVFDGCYTTHSEVKQLNRQAEAITTSAEAIAAIASLQGFKYPGSNFRRNWEDICINHHHDTLPGSGIHAPYENTKIMLGRVIADDRDIINRAMQTMTLRVTPNKGGINVMVCNPLGWSRSGWVQTLLVHSGWDGGERLNPAQCAAFGPDGKASAVELLDAPSRRARFWADDVPAFGYKVFQIKNSVPEPIRYKLIGSAATIETSSYVAKFDESKGAISSLVDKRTKKELVAPGGHLGLPEVHWEDPAGMSAWVLGKISKFETLPTYTGGGFTEVGGELQWTSKFILLKRKGDYGDSVLSQTFHFDPKTDEIWVDVDCDWEAIGNPQTPNPLIRVAFQTAFQNPTATYQIPFGAIVRPTDAKECAALEWGDLSDGDSGLAILNDSKHGYNADGSTLRLSLIRSSFEPDPVPNPGMHHWRYAVAPHKGSWAASGISRAAAEFNQPMYGATVPFDAKGDQPLQWSLLSFSDPTVVPTVLKKAEDDGDFVVRFYQASPSESKGKIEINVPTKTASWVNFVEDHLGPAAVANKSVDTGMHGFEIKSLKFSH